MKSMRRAPLWGLVVIITLTLIIIVTSIQCVKLKEINNSLNTTINEQTKTIKVLENDKTDLTIQVSQLEEQINNYKKQEKSILTTNTLTHRGTTQVKFIISAYCHCSKCCGKSDGITATGTKATENRTIAVDPKIIPLGSKVIIDGQTYIAEDTGGDIKGNRIDMYFSSHEEALNWGIQYRYVTIIK